MFVVLVCSVFFMIVIVRVHACCTRSCSCPRSCSVFVSLLLFVFSCVFLCLCFVRVLVSVIVRCCCYCGVFVVRVRVRVICIVPVMCARSCYRSKHVLLVISSVIVIVIGIDLGRVLCSCSFFVSCVRALVLCYAPLSVVISVERCSSSWS